MVVLHHGGEPVEPLDHSGLISVLEPALPYPCRTRSSRTIAISRATDLSGDGSAGRIVPATDRLAKNRLGPRATGLSSTGGERGQGTDLEAAPAARAGTHQREHRVSTLQPVAPGGTGTPARRSVDAHVGPGATRPDTGHFSHSCHPLQKWLRHRFALPAPDARPFQVRSHTDVVQPDISKYTRGDVGIVTTCTTTERTAAGTASRSSWTPLTTPPSGTRVARLTWPRPARGGSMPSPGSSGRLPGSVVQSVRTGNVEPNARVRIGAFGLDEWLDWSVGAFGEAHEVLGRLVTRRGRQGRRRVRLRPSPGRDSRHRGTPRSTSRPAVTAPPGSWPSHLASPPSTSWRPRGPTHSARPA